MNSSVCHNERRSGREVRSISPRTFLPLPFPRSRLRMTGGSEEELKRVFTSVGTPGGDHSESASGGRRSLGGGPVLASANAVRTN